MNYALGTLVLILVTMAANEIYFRIIIRRLREKEQRARQARNDALNELQEARAKRLRDLHPSYGEAFEVIERARKKSAGKDIHH